MKFLQINVCNPRQQAQAGLLGKMAEIHLRQCTKHVLNSTNVQLCLHHEAFECRVCGASEKLARNGTGIPASQAHEWICQAMAQHDTFALLHTHETARKQ